MSDRMKELKPGHEWVMVDDQRVIAVDKSHDRSWVIYVRKESVSNYFCGGCYTTRREIHWKPVSQPRPMTPLEAWVMLAEFLKKGIIPEVKLKIGKYWTECFEYNLAYPKELEYRIPGDDTVYQFEVQE